MTRRLTRPSTPTGFTASPAPVPSPAASEITYKGYRIEPESYSVNSTAWSPRAVVSVKSDDGWARQAPLYSPSTAKFLTRDAADRSALEVARAWIDTTLERRRD